MSPLSRLLTFSLVTLLVLITAGLGAQTWLRQQETRILRSAELGLRQQLEHAVALTGGPATPWDENRLATVAQVTGAELNFFDGPLDDDTAEAFHVSIPLGGTRWLVAARPAPAGERILNLLQRVTIALGVFAVVLGAVLAFTIGIRPLRDRDTRSPFVTRERDMRSLSLLAHTSVRQQAELDQARDDRLRAEADARLRLQLLNRALEEKIRIGRDLHDGVIQSLYATGLTLQSSQQEVGHNPSLAAQRVEQALQLINRTIGDIRDYIAGLSARQVRRDSLAQGFRDIGEELRAGRDVEVEVEVDAAAAGLLSDEQLADSIQIAREAMSNALRHGGATAIHLKLSGEFDQVSLSVRDNGSGFNPDRPGHLGHGLTNMKARMMRTHGRLELDSAPGQGTSVQAIWLPLPPPAT